MEFDITPEDVQAARERGDKFLLLDVREPWEYETAHIENSRLLPMDEIPKRVQELDPDEHIIVMCHHGVRSANVTVWMREQGFERVQSMRGGIDRWSRYVDPKVPLY